MSKPERHKLTVENFPSYAFAFYGVAIDEAAKLAVRSFMEYSEITAEGGSAADAAGVLHEALNHCAAISRFFWPPKSAGAVGKFRGERLREMYDIASNSPLNNRDLRNRLEHLDEKIDEWLSFDPVGPILPGPIFAHHTVVDDGIGHAFKVIDRENDVYVVMGQKFEFASLSRAAAKVLIRANCI